MDIMNLLFSYKGRIRRMHFWLALVGIWIVEFIALMALGAMFHPTLVMGMPQYSGVGMIVMWVIYIAIVYVAGAVSVKRMHDTDRSGWWVLLPIFNIVVCGFFAGTAGPNKFGPDPKGGTAPAAAA
jgi:uncharacterized membrane protein YhaH (DUF805 family)